VGEYGEVISIPMPPAKSNTGTATKPKTRVQKKNVVNMNTGLILAFDAQYALDAIKQNPTGPQ
jgi:hypothetical protein